MYCTPFGYRVISKLGLLGLVIVGVVVLPFGGLWPVAMTFFKEIYILTFTP